MPGGRASCSHLPLTVMPQRSSVLRGIGIGDLDGWLSSQGVLSQISAERLWGAATEVQVAARVQGVFALPMGI